MAEAGTKNLGRRIAIGAAVAVLGYVLLILVFPRVLDGYQYHALSDRLGAQGDRLGSIERSLAVLRDRTETRPGAYTNGGAVEASLASKNGPLDDAALSDRLDRMTLALERLEAAVEAQTRALEALAPLFEPPGTQLEAGDGE